MLSVARWFAVAGALVCAPLGLAQSGQQLLDEILSVELDPEACYRVRDVFVEREDIRLYLTDGYLIFGKPVAGRPVLALFTATEPTDEGEVLIIPPSERERASLNRALGEPVLDEKFRTATLYFTDDTAEAIRAGFATAPIARPDPDKGALLARRWNYALGGIIENVSLRMLLDLASPETAGGGFFGAVLSGGRRGAFDVAVDPRLEEQIHAGQVRRRDTTEVAETWTRFEARGVRSGQRQRAKQPVRFGEYEIDVDLDEELALEAVARVRLRDVAAATRAFAFRLSRRLRVASITIDGQEAEFHQREPAESVDEWRLSDSVTVLMPPDCVGAEELAMEVRYAGRVIEEAGNGVYFVGSRTGWYPRGEPEFTHYRLSFRYPARLRLAATGRLVEESGDGVVATSRWETPSPIHLAGFNIGDYTRAVREADGYTVEVLANQATEKRLEVDASPTVVLVPQQARRRRLGGQSTRGSSVIVRPPVTQPRPADHVDEVADEALRAFTFFRSLLGEPPFEHLSITPIPGDFGQGFPGLVYASTLSFLRPGDAPIDRLSPPRQRFYTHLLPAHEISHQWWGHTVRVDTEAENWIMEALATYSSLLYLEERFGEGVIPATLEQFRQHLLEENDDGLQVESSGPVVLGERLNSAAFPNARHTIVYEKGAWVLHMLRNILGDEKFREMLAQLTAEYRFRPITTEEFRGFAARYAPEDWPDEGLESFFEQWVLRTGIPEFKVRYDVKGNKAPYTLEGRIDRGEVPERWTLVVPVEIRTDTGASLAKMITTDGEETEFRVTALRSRPVSVVVDPKNSLLRRGRAGP